MNWSRLGVVALFMAGCTESPQTSNSLTLATTTSTYDSGLLDSSLAAVTESTSRFVPRDYSRYYGVRLKVGI